MRSAIVIAALSARVAFASPLPQDDPVAVLPVQPPTGGSSADDCGSGPLDFNKDTWNAKGMNDVVESFYDANNGDTFDFHQRFAQQYGVGLYCQDAADVCVNTPSSCLQLQGDSTADKEQGYLGIRAIENAQTIFVSMDSAIDRAANNLLSSLGSFSNQFLKKEDNQGKFKALLTGLVGILGAVLGTTGDAGAIAGSFLAAGAGIGAEFLPEKDPLAAFANAEAIWGQAQNGFHLALNATHSALFSNGAVEGQSAQGANSALPSWMKDGAMMEVADYVQLYTDLDSTFTKVLALKLLESTALGQNGFMMFIEGVVDDCPDWKGDENPLNMGFSITQKFCAPEGMYYLVGLNDDNQPFELQGFDKVSDWSNFNFDLQGLLHSTAWSYSWYGLDYQSTADDWKNILERDRNGQDIASQLGAFQIPVCKIEAWNWKQSDYMSKDTPPCDCKNVADKNGKKFIDSDNVSQKVKDWINSKCK